MNTLLENITKHFPNCTHLTVSQSKISSLTMSPMVTDNFSIFVSCGQAEVGFCPPPCNTTDKLLPPKNLVSHAFRKRIAWVTSATPVTQRSQFHELRDWIRWVRISRFSRHNAKLGPMVYVISLKFVDTACIGGLGWVQPANRFASFQRKRSSICLMPDFQNH